MSQKVRCSNCFTKKNPKSFYTKKSEINKNCKTCVSIIKEFENDPSHAERLLFDVEIMQLEEFPNKYCISIKREMAKYVAAYRAGQLESCEMFLGRATEYLVRYICKRLDLEARPPKVSSIDNVQEKINRLRNLTSDAKLGTSKAQWAAKVVKASKEIANNAIDIAIDVDRIGTQEADRNALGIDHARKQIIVWMKRNYEKEDVEKYESLIDGIMKMRNKAAHPEPEGRRTTPRKRDVKCMHKQVRRLFQFAYLIIQKSALPA